MTQAYQKLIKPRSSRPSKSVIHSVRFSPTISELVRAESHAQKLSVSEFMRRAALASMRYMRRQASNSGEGDRLSYEKRGGGNQQKSNDPKETKIVQIGVELTGETEPPQANNSTNY